MVEAEPVPAASKTKSAYTTDEILRIGKAGIYDPIESTTSGYDVGGQ